MAGSKEQGFVSVLKSSVWLQALCVFLFVFSIYFVTSQDSNPYNHYVLLADAFLHGRTFIANPPDYLELARYDGRGFVINPPAPALLLVPLVALFGVGFNQVLVSVFFGALAAALFWAASRNLRFSLKLSIAATVLFAFGTNFWWASADGGVWTFAHVSAVFFLSAALLESTGKNRPLLVGALVGLAGLSRLTSFLTFPFYAFMICRGKLDRKNMSRLVLFAVALAAMAGVYLGYNYVRYGTLLDAGYDHPQYDGQPWFDKGRFSIDYFPRHLLALFSPGPVFSGEFPFLKPSFVGLGLFLTTPAFLYAFLARRKKMLVASAAGVLLTSLLLFAHGTTGWAQFGYRYSLDVLPLLLLLSADGFRRLGRLEWAVIALSVAVNLWGTLAYKFKWL